MLKKLKELEGTERYSPGSRELMDGPAGGGRGGGSAGTVEWLKIWCYVGCSFLRQALRMSDVRPTLELEMHYGRDVGDIREIKTCVYDKRQTAEVTT